MASRKADGGMPFIIEFLFPFLPVHSGVPFLIYGIFPGIQFLCPEQDAFRRESLQVLQFLAGTFPGGDEHLQAVLQVTDVLFDHPFKGPRVHCLLQAGNRYKASSIFWWYSDPPLWNGYISCSARSGMRVPRKQRNKWHRHNKH